MIRLIASDMDGTLLDGNSKVPHETFGLIHDLWSEGVRFCVSSGRPYSFLRMVFAPVADEMDFVCNNGAVVWVQGTRIAREVFSYGALMKLKALVDRFDILHLNASDSHGGYLMDTGEKRDRFLNDNPWARQHMSLEQPGPETNFIYGGVHMDRAALERDDVSIMDFAYILNMELGDFFTFAPTDARGIDVFPAHVSKATGIRHVMEYYDVWRSEVMAYGDAMNDYEIMRMVGHLIAMGNALYGLKQVCERVIETNLEHGVQKDLARLLARIRAGEDSERISFDEEDE